MDPLFITHLPLTLAGVFYLLALACAMSHFLGEKSGIFARLFLALAVAANCAAVALRYYHAWPMLPMHLGAAAWPLSLGIPALWALCSSQDDEPAARLVWRGVLVLATLTAWLAICLPKDFYLPFTKSNTVFSHAYLWFGLAGKSCLAICAAWALAALLAAPANVLIAMRHGQRWAALGFILWTLSMFSGEMWSYLGWGTPVVWDDPAITLTMAAWFFYAGILHLHLSRRWPLFARAACIVFGGLIVLAFTCLPDFGPWRSPLP